MMAKLDRRDFIRSSVLAGLLAPIAGYWSSDRAGAQPSADRRNMILIFLPNGKVQANPFITGSGTSFSYEDGFRPYEAFKSDSIAIQQYGFQAFIGREYGGDHGGHIAPGAVMFSGEVPYVTGGAARGAMAPSIDQIVAWDRMRRGVIDDPLRATLNIKMSGSSFRLPTVFTATPADYALGRTYDRPLDPIVQHSRPQAGFEQLFGDLAGMSGDSVASLWAFGRSVLDVPNAELRRLRPRLPTEGALLVDEHLQALRDLETSLAADGPAPGMVPEAPGTVDTAPTNHVAVWSHWIRLIDAAIRLDRTHLFSIQFGGIASRFSVPELDLGFVGEAGDGNSGRDHHSYTHWDGSRVPRFMNWFAERIAELLSVLKGGGSRPDLLPETAVMVGMEFGRNHNARDVPVTLFGQAGGYFRTGRTVTYDNEIDGTHKHTGTLLSMCHAMGVTDLRAVGHPKAEYQRGPADELRG